VDREIDEQRRSLCACMIVPGGAALMLRKAFAAQDAPTQGVRRLTGAVYVNGKSARNLDPVKPGDVVITGPNSYAVFVMGEDAFLVRSDSKVEFGGEGRLINFLRLVTGKLLSVYASGKGMRTVQTLTATIGIRGTGAYIDAEAARTYFCLCYGEAEIVPTAEPTKTQLFRTSHHDSPLYIGNDAKTGFITEARVENHQDAELILLESLVDRQPPFMQHDGKRS
jgi:hypothetical protein